MDWNRFGQAIVLQHYKPSSLEERLLRADVARAQPVRNETANAGSSNATAVILTDGGGPLAAYHKPLDGINPDQAAKYGHDPLSALVNESAAWLIAQFLGAPYRTMVPDMVIRSIWPSSSAADFVGGFGAMSVEAPGDTGKKEPLRDPAECDPAALFDAIIGQQDRHDTNYRWQPGRLGLLDNAYAFAAPDPGRYLKWASKFVHERHASGRSSLREDERDLLSGLQATTWLWSWLNRILRLDQVEALRDRVERMLASGRLLDPLEF